MDYARRRIGGNAKRLVRSGEGPHETELHARREHCIARRSEVFARGELGTVVRVVRTRRARRMLEIERSRIPRLGVNGSFDRRTDVTSAMRQRMPRADDANSRLDAQTNQYSESKERKPELLTLQTCTQRRVACHSASAAMDPPMVPPARRLLTHGDATPVREKARPPSCSPPPEPRLMNRYSPTCRAAGRSRSLAERRSSRQNTPLPLSCGASTLLTAPRSVTTTCSTQEVVRVKFAFELQEIAVVNPPVTSMLRGADLPLGAIPRSRAVAGRLRFDLDLREGPIDTGPRGFSSKARRR